jgi:ppGpp synthetase/RelA/SpoT-type nucleotidyltranferase
MKIPRSIRDLYSEQKERADLLRKRVDPLIKGRLHERWHYESRIKGDESFALKLETGRITNVQAMEDFFALTIVVRNSTEIPAAEALARELFDFDSRKPAVDDETHKAPEQFPFDDLRLQVRWRDDPALPPTGLAGAIFEIQVKTFLQHAWSIATHELTYKTDDPNWGKRRIAYQIKAMLEHAELSIQEATVLSASPALNKSDARTTLKKQYITIISELWAKADLPGDIGRLAENVMVLTKLVGIGASELKTLLEAASAQGKGPLTQNLTPYGTVVQTLLDNKRVEFTAGLQRQLKDRRSVPIILTSELQLPPDVESELWRKTTLRIG